MELNEYQQRALDAAFFIERSGQIESLAYLAIALPGETGEVCEKIKKMYRDNDGKLTPEIAESIAKELGDVQWYLSVMAKVIGYDLNTVCEMNLQKLADRTARNTLRGSGDNR